MKQTLLTLASTLLIALAATAQVPEPVIAYRFAAGSLNDDYSTTPLVAVQGSLIRNGGNTGTAQGDHSLRTTPAGAKRSGSGPLVANASFSVSMWFYLDTNPNDAFFFYDSRGNDGFDPGYYGYYDYTKKQFVMGGTKGNIKATHVLGANAWHHVTFVNDATARSRKIYVDGSLITGTDVRYPFETPNPANTLFFGDYAGTVRNTYNLSGRIDEIFVFDQALTLSQTNLLREQTPPTTPGQIVYTNRTTSGITATWGGSTDLNEVRGYEIAVPGLGVMFSKTPSYTFTGLSTATRYTGEVRAVDQAGNPSAQASALEFSTAGNVDTQRPSAIANLRTTSITSNSLSLAWDAATDDVGVTRYVIYYRDITAGLAADNRDTVPAATLTYIASMLRAGHDYRVAVTALDAAGNSGQPTIRTFSTSAAAADNQSPTQPGAVSAGNVTTSGFAISWGASTDNVGVTRYAVSHGINPGSRGGGVPARTQDTVTATSKVFTGLNADTEYLVEIKALDAAGNASRPRQFIISTAGAADVQAPSVPTGLMVTDLTPSAFSVTWTASNDNVEVTQYLVEIVDLATNQTVGSGRSPAVQRLASFSSAVPGGRYLVRVSAEDAALNRSAAATIEVETPSVVTDDLMHAYDFNADASDGVGQLDLTLSAGTSLAVDRFGAASAALGLDGGYAASDDLGGALRSRDFTYAMWLRGDEGRDTSTSGYRYIFDNRQVADVTNPQGIFARLDLAAKTLEFGGTVFLPEFTGSNTAAQSLTVVDFVLPKGQWTHLAFGYDVRTGKRSVYLDGVRATTILDPSDRNSRHLMFDGPTRFGRDVRNEFNALRGKMDDLRVYQRAIDDVLATALYAMRDSVAPATPQTFVANNLTPTSASLNWTAATDAQGIDAYLVAIEQDSFTVEGNTLTYAADGLTPGAGYEATLVAIDFQGNRSAVKKVVFTTPMSSSTHKELALPNFRVFPNPATNGAELKFAGLPLAAKLTISDVRGRAVTSSAFAKTQQHISLATLPPGVYVVRAVLPQGVATRTVVVQ